MTALSFQPQFVDSVLWGLGLSYPRGHQLDCASGKPKIQTIRRKRVDGRPPAKPGDRLQLYCRQRHPQGFLIGEARCTEVREITIRFQLQSKDLCIANAIWIDGRGEWIVQSDDHPNRLDEFARADGFSDWAMMRDFWKKHHPDVSHFEGWIIYWEPLK